MYDLDQHKWWHSIQFPNGQKTKGEIDYDAPREGTDQLRRDRFLIPQNLTGKSVLDFGTWNGYWAILAKQRGADVLAMDRWDPILKTTELALGAYEIPYECSGDLDEPISRKDLKEKFDVVFLFGITYHLKNPFMGIWNAKFCCKDGGLIIVESNINQGPIKTLPRDLPLIYLADKPYCPDRTSYNVINEAGICQMIKNFDLTIEDTDMTEPSRFTVLCRKGKEET